MITAMSAPEGQREFRSGWSLWRRAHQAVAKRCHQASHRAKHAAHHFADHDVPEDKGHGTDPADPANSIRPPEAGRITDVEWERVRELMPKQKPGMGQPRRDDRRVLSGILWVLETGSSWKEMPEERFGSNRTVQRRYHKWLKEGLWARIVQALGR
jgi:hypothetical protein